MVIEKWIFEEDVSSCIWQENSLPVLLPKLTGTSAKCIYDGWTELKNSDLLKHFFPHLMLVNHFMWTEAYNMCNGDLKRSSTIPVSLRSCSLGSLLNYKEPNPLDISYFSEVRKNSSKKKSFSNLHDTKVPDSMISRIWIRNNYMELEAVKLKKSA